MTPEVQEMLAEAKTFTQKNDAYYKTLCVRIVERLLVEGNLVHSSPISTLPPKVWNKNRTKYDLDCGGCMIPLAPGTIAYLTKGERPRCLDCGVPPGDIIR